MFLFQAKGKKGEREHIEMPEVVIEGKGAKAFKPAKQAPAVAVVPTPAAKPVLAQKPTRVVTPAAAQAASQQQLFNERWLAQLRTQIGETRNMLMTYPLRGGTATDAANLSRRMDALDETLASVEGRIRSMDPRQAAGVIQREVRNPFHAEYAKVEKLLGLGQHAKGQRLAKL